MLISSATARDRDHSIYELPSATVLNAWLDRTLREFRDRIIVVDQAIADRWGRLGTPDPIPVIDGLIAATALERGLIVATRNNMSRPQAHSASTRSR